MHVHPWRRQKVLKSSCIVISVLFEKVLEMLLSLLRLLEEWFAFYSAEMPSRRQHRSGIWHRDDDQQHSGLTP